MAGPHPTGYGDASNPEGVGPAALDESFGVESFRARDRAGLVEQGRDGRGIVQRGRDVDTGQQCRGAQG